MSGCSYSCMVIPSSDAFDFVPTMPQLKGVVELLARQGWIEPARATKTGWQAVVATGAGANFSYTKTALDENELSRSLEAFAAAKDFAIRFENERGRDDPTPFQLDSEGIFRPQYCENAYVFVSSVLLAVEDPDGTHEIACSHCTRNVLRDRKEHEEASIRRALWQPRNYVGPDCPACGATLDIPDLSMSFTAAVDGPQPRLERAPFFRFGLWFLAESKRYPDKERIHLAPLLLGGLEAVCGAPFRSIGTLGSA